MTLALAMIFFFFLDMALKAQATAAKLNEWDYIKLNSFRTAKENHEQDEQASHGREAITRKPPI